MQPPQRPRPKCTSQCSDEGERLWNKKAGRIRGSTDPTGVWRVRSGKAGTMRRGLLDRSRSMREGAPACHLTRCSSCFLRYRMRFRCRQHLVPAFDPSCCKGLLCPERNIVAPGQPPTRSVTSAQQLLQHLGAQAHRQEKPHGGTGHSCPTATATPGGKAWRGPRKQYREAGVVGQVQHFQGVQDGHAGGNLGPGAGQVEAPHVQRPQLPCRPHI